MPPPMISLFDEKCLKALANLREPWRVPLAAQAWCTDCQEAQVIISRYLQAGWLMMPHPGNYRLTTAGRNVISFSTQPAVDHYTRLPARIERRLTLDTLTQIAAHGVVTTRSLARIIGKTDEATRKTLHKLRDRSWVEPCSRDGHFQEWALTETGLAAMKDLAAALKAT